MIKPRIYEKIPQIINHKRLAFMVEKIIAYSKKSPFIIFVEMEKIHHGEFVYLLYKYPGH